MIILFWCWLLFFFFCHAGLKYIICLFNVIPLFFLLISFCFPCLCLLSIFTPSNDGTSIELKSLGYKMISE